MQTADNPDQIFELASVKSSPYDYVVNAAVSGCYRSKQQDMSRYDTDTNFTSCLKSKVEISTLATTIGCTTTSNDNCCLFASPTSFTSEELEPLS